MIGQVQVKISSQVDALRKQKQILIKKEKK
jgi:hypothetical protein